MESRALALRPRCATVHAPSLECLPNELLLLVLSHLDVDDLLSTSRTSHLLRRLSLLPILHALRLRRARLLLPPLLSSPSRPSRADLIARQVFLTPTSLISRRLARNLVSIRLARRLAARPDPHALALRAVLPRECIPGLASPVCVAPALVASRRAVERARIHNHLKRWVEAHWQHRVDEHAKSVARADETLGTGRVWRLTRYWERVAKGEPRILG
ncbi:hypothetical protein CDD82_273 [Ophiocordyceps australis]|uniref:F-box domain-containing protein n=1 Tax=Ophiocordyceps australis TaxID=1399860 RepID=A0A2C5YP38_9HYPO|nr:hypothetical protein CDD82_273 [Ophiocordyceps australis]